MSEFLPKGTIVAMYSLDPIPKGWVLCDGNNGTPDLRNRFIKGADDHEAVGTKTTYTSIRVPEGGRKGSDYHWGETPWANGPNPVIGGQEIPLPPYVSLIYIMYKGVTV